MSWAFVALWLAGAPAAAAKYNAEGFRAYQQQRYQDALALFKKGFEADEKHALSHYNFAATLGLLRKQGKVCEFDAYQSAVLEHLERAVQLDEGRRKRMVNDADFDSVRDTLRYQRLLGRDPARDGDVGALVVAVTWLAPAPGAYGNMAELDFAADSTFTLSRKVMNDDGEVKVVKHAGKFVVSGREVTLMLSSPLDGKRELRGKLTPEGRLVLDVLGTLTDERSECDA